MPPPDIQRISDALNIEVRADRRIVTCAECAHEICAAGKGWKPAAVLHERQIREVADTYSAGEQVLLRSFACPNCGTLLDTEIAVAGDPFLDDIIFLRGETPCTTSV